MLTFVQKTDQFYSNSRYTYQGRFKQTRLVALSLVKIFMGLMVNICNMIKIPLVLIAKVDITIKMSLGLLFCLKPWMPFMEITIKMSLGLLFCLKPWMHSMEGTKSKWKRGWICLRKQSFYSERRYWELVFILRGPFMAWEFF